MGNIVGKRKNVSWVILVDETSQSPVKHEDVAVAADEYIVRF